MQVSRELSHGTWLCLRSFIPYGKEQGGCQRILTYVCFLTADCYASLLCDLLLKLKAGVLVQHM